MCLAIVALNAHPQFALVVAANRDEYHDRTARPAAWGTASPYIDVLAGRDLTAGGTWLGVSRSGRFAFVTNVREPGRNLAAAPSRGELVPFVLASDRSCAATTEELQGKAQRYNGFNLVFGDHREATWLSNRRFSNHRFSNRASTRGLTTGVHGVSNAALDTPWPKLERTRDGVTAWAQRGDTSLEHLFGLLADRGIAADAALPSTGVALEWERRLSAPFIVSPNYGTRCTSVLAISQDGRATFMERSFDAAGEPAGEVAFDFTLSG